MGSQLCSLAPRNGASIKRLRSRYSRAVPEGTMVRIRALSRHGSRGPQVLLEPHGRTQHDFGLRPQLPTRHFVRLGGSVRAGIPLASARPSIASVSSRTVHLLPVEIAPISAADHSLCAAFPATPMLALTSTMAPFKIWPHILTFFASRSQCI